MKINTALAQAGVDADSKFLGLTPPIDLAVTFQKSERKSDFFYAVFDNPNRKNLEATMAVFEGGEEAIAFSSGSAAISSIFLSCVPGDHLILPKDVFQGTARLLNDNFETWGLHFSFVDMSEPEAIETHILPNTKFIWLESPSNPLIRLTNFQDVVEVAKRHQIMTVCDNTYMPLIQRPMDFDIDFTVYSTTKYISGHNDTVGGMVIARQKSELSAKIRTVQQNFGMVPSPFESWLTLRGMRTLAVRMREISRNAAKIVDYLRAHPIVERVNYPSLSPLYPLLKKTGQLSDCYGGMLSFELKPEYSATSLLKNLKIFKNATSLGGTISLIENRSTSPIQNIGQGTGLDLPKSLLRISTGLEAPADLIADLDYALSHLETNFKD